MHLTDVALVAFITLGLIAVTCAGLTVLVCYLCHVHSARVEPSSASSSATNLVMDYTSSDVGNPPYYEEQQQQQQQRQIPVAIVCN